jgi:hypothetical protein
MVMRRTFIGAALGALAGCGGQGLPHNTWDLRYRITVRASVAGRACSGASVFRSLFRRVDSSVEDLATARFRARVWGEAIAVEMGERGWLVGALGQVFGVNSDHQFSVEHDRAITRILSAETQDLEAFESGRLYERLQSLEGEHPLPPVLWPVFLTFADIGDLSSVRALPVGGYRYRLGRNVASTSLDRAFGPGARIDAVTFETTRDQVTRRLERIAPWLDELKSKRSRHHVRNVEMPLEQTLKYRNFVLNGSRQ